MIYRPLSPRWLVAKLKVPFRLGLRRGEYGFPLVGCTWHVQINAAFPKLFSHRESFNACSEFFKIPKPISDWSKSTCMSRYSQGRPRDRAINQSVAWARWRAFVTENFHYPQWSAQVPKSFSLSIFLISSMKEGFWTALNRNWGPCPSCIQNPLQQLSWSSSAPNPKGGANPRCFDPSKSLGET